MTHEEKINYMRIAANIAGFGLKNEHLDSLVSVYELILEKQGNADIKDVVQIEHEVKKRTDIKSKSDLLDKVSTELK